MKITRIGSTTLDVVLYIGRISGAGDTIAGNAEIEAGTAKSKMG